MTTDVIIVWNALYMFIPYCVCIVIDYQTQRTLDNTLELHSNATWRADVLSGHSLNGI